ncbi:methyltransferase domain-containing protein [Crenobacter caeni]|uniref:Methyltransferase domain-containing protein n=1 Tax=Crenobacter caeni TaxID=2705474 RepID=A0A6B2KNS0_9NEIS|nr:methyltransferase domain-containing protein [Crenobacter caeni]NDV11731.1 methyltransferase domain-containing protein [Crenobacter caeni]
MAQDSSQPDFWETRYLGGVKPWDSAGCIPAALSAFVARQRPGREVLLPGCGAAYEVAYLADAGFTPDGVDFSEAALAAARDALGPYARHVRQGDVFALAGPYDWVYERAFLCALPPRLWSAYAEAMARLVRPGGWLAGAFFIAERPKGPPFGASRQLLNDLLGDAFDCVECEAMDDSLPVFSGGEFWMSWRRR